MSNQSEMWPQLKVKYKEHSAARGKSQSSRLAASLDCGVLQGWGFLGVSAIVASEDTNTVCRGFVLQRRTCLCLVNQRQESSNSRAPPGGPSS